MKKVKLVSVKIKSVESINKELNKLLKALDNIRSHCNTMLALNDNKEEPSVVTKVKKTAKSEKTSEKTSEKVKKTAAKRKTAKAKK